MEKNQETHTVQPSKKNQKGYLVPLVAMSTIFFLFGGLTALNSNVLTPFAREAFGFTAGESMAINFAFFIAYFVMSLPSSSLIAKIGYKKSVVVGLFTIAVGSLIYILSIEAESSAIFLIATFIVASGIALLQVAANPYLAKLGPAKTASMRITIGGALNSLATYLGPMLGGIYILGAANQGQVLSLTYIGLALVVAIVAVVIFLSDLPEIGGEDGEQEEVVEGDSPFDFRNFRFGLGGIFAYVGAEVATGTFIVYYLTDVIGGFTAAQGAQYAAYYWFLAMVGRFAGVPILNKVSSQTALKVSASINVLLIVASMFVSKEAAITVSSLTIPLPVILLILVGLFNSVMWGCIFALAVDGLGQHTNKASGYLMMAVAGGAVIPAIQGAIGDEIGIRAAFFVTALCYLYLVFYAVNGYKKKA